LFLVFKSFYWNTSVIDGTLPWYVFMLLYKIFCFAELWNNNVNYNWMVNFNLTIEYFWHSENRASWYTLIIKTNEMHCFSNLFDKVLYMFRTGSLPIIKLSQLCIHAIDICHDSSVGCYNIARCSVWVWNLVANIEGGT